MLQNLVVEAIDVNFECNPTVNKLNVSVGCSVDELIHS